MQNLLAWLIKIDKQIFLFINQTLANPVFDFILPIWRNANTWILLYIFVLYLAIKKYKKQSWIWLFFALITVVITDQVSSHFIKNLVARDRPYLDPNFHTQVRLLLSNINRGFSFTSSHATNHFGIALFFITTLSSTFQKYKYLFIAWATIVCFAQVYVGLHFPLDVLCGGILGTIIGKVTATIFNKNFAPKNYYSNLN